MSQKTAPLKFYRHLDAAAHYGVTVAAMRKWRAMGRQSGDPFPQENPVEVVKWYGRHFRKSVPHRLWEVAQQWSGKEFLRM